MLGARPNGGGCGDEAYGKGLQMEAAIEAIGEGGQVPLAVLGEVKRRVSAAETRLEVAKEGVDPQKLRQLLGLAAADDGRLVLANHTGSGLAL